MKYFRLFELQNQYPTIQSYTRENTVSSVNSLYNHGDAVLKGIFPENERRFPLSNIAFIRPIANTSIRFILKVKKSADDEFPRYFTSFNYFAELEQSITTPNPYFLNISLLDTNIVEFDLSDSIAQFKNQIESEGIRNVKMFKNNFLKIIDTKRKDTKTATYGDDPTAVVLPEPTVETPVFNTSYQPPKGGQVGEYGGMSQSEIDQQKLNDALLQGGVYRGVGDTKQVAIRERNLNRAVE
jgi:hypothetical protein